MVIIRFRLDRPVFQSLQPLATLLASGNQQTLPLPKPKQEKKFTSIPILIAFFLNDLNLNLGLTGLFNFQQNSYFQNPGLLLLLTELPSGLGGVEVDVDGPGVL